MQKNRSKIKLAQAAQGPYLFRIVQILKHRWPTLVGIGIALVMPDSLLPAAMILILASLIYPISGAIRKHLSGTRMLLIQTIAFISFVALVLVALYMNEGMARYLLAAAYLGHAVWDFAHHRADKIVPRWYAEFCAVLDVLVASILFFLPLF